MRVTQWCPFPFITGQGAKRGCRRSVSEHTLPDRLPTPPNLRAQERSDPRFDRVIKASSVLIDGRTAHRRTPERHLTEPVQAEVFTAICRAHLASGRWPIAARRRTPRLEVPAASPPTSR